MPPKGGANKKVVQKQADKIIEDKTFGLKNKSKSKKVQDYVASVHKQVNHAVQTKIAGGDAELRKAAAAKKAKEAAAAMEKEMQALLRASIKQPKLEPGVDPKSVLCEFFKHGVCEKGDKCKFSHDLTIGRKAAKIDLYSDRREDKKEDETMSEWDQEKLESVVKTKHGAESGKKTTTEIVCKFFLDAIEKELYGWFWRCPNGDDCKYRHALPPGYVYKSKSQRELEAAAKLNETMNQTTLEELIEEQRRTLPTTGLTPVTEESFKKWKDARAARKASELEAKRVEEAKKTGTKGYNVLSGRALFSYDPSLFVDDADADDDVYSEDGDNESPAAGAGEPPADTEGAIDESVFLAGDDVDDLPDDDDDDDE